MTMISTVAVNQYLRISRKRKLTMWNSVFVRFWTYVIQHFLFHLFPVHSNCICMHITV